MMDLRTSTTRRTEADRALRRDWTRAEALGLYDLPFMDFSSALNACTAARSIRTRCR